MSRDGGGRSRQDELGRNIYSKVARSLSNRREVLCPFEIPVVSGLLKYALTQTQWRAYDTLVRNDSANQSIEKVNFVRVVRDEGFSLRVFPPNSAGRLPYFPVDYDGLPLQTQIYVHNWVMRAESLRRENDIIIDRVESLLRECATPGQVLRVWPELVGFMPENGKQAFYSSRAKSPYPFGVIQGEDERGRVILYSAFRPSVLTHFNHALAEALLLPRCSREYRFPEYTLA